MFLVDIIVDALSVFLIMLPVMILFPKYMKKQKVITSINHSIGVAFYIIVIAIILSINGIPSLLYMKIDLSFNLMPFQDIAYNYPLYIQSGIGFILLGFLLPVLWKSNRSLKNTLLYGFLFSLFIEVMQIFCSRVSDVNDLIFNTIGLLTGYIIFTLVYHINADIFDDSYLRFRNIKYTKACVRYEFVFYMLLIFVVMFCVQASISNWVWRIIYTIALV